MYLDAALQALATLLQPTYLVWLLGGVVVGVVVGALPGIGGMVAMSLVLPFIYGQDPRGALAMMIGTGAACAMGDSISSILFGIPGGGGSMATIIDGFPMTRKGKAPQALGAAFLASAIGGIFGAFCIFLILPVVRPLVLSMASPEFLLLTLMGVLMVGMLAGKEPIKGILAGCLGLMLSAVGGAPFAGLFRYDLGWDYLADGVPLVVVALGIFAIPEIINLLVGGTQIAAKDSGFTGIVRGMFEGMNAVRRNLGLVLRCSGIGAYIGFLPGLGAAVSQWIAYGHSVQSSRDKSMFGKGDIRGVIGPEAVRNATVAGDLIPTMFFGIPGSSTMTLVLAAFVILNVLPGRQMFTTGLPLSLTIIWSLVLGNVFAMIICMSLVRPLAALTKIRIYYLAPFIIMIVVLGAFQTTRHWGDLIMLLAFGLLGLIMKRYGWERPPFVVGFVLGDLAERYMWLTLNGYDNLSWLLRPGVIIIAVCIIASILLSARMSASKSTKPLAVGGGDED